MVSKENLPKINTFLKMSVLLYNKHSKNDFSILALNYEHNTTKIDLVHISSRHI